MRLNTTGNYTTIVTGHGNIKSYLYKYKTIDSPMCPCTKGQQTAQHTAHYRQANVSLHKRSANSTTHCPLLEKEREKLKAVVTRTENWPVSCNKVGIQYYKNFKEYMGKISCNMEQSTNSQLRF